MPVVGFRPLIAGASSTKSAIGKALSVGYRHFDCAQRFLNERELGRALRDRLLSGEVRREEIFITTRVWTRRRQLIRPAIDASLERLKVDYLDLYLMQVPLAVLPAGEHDRRDSSGNILRLEHAMLRDAWRGMEDLVDSGKCRAIGLSDTSLVELGHLYKSARIKPAVVQVEAHPYHPRTELLMFCKAHGIAFLTFSPLGRGVKPGPLDDGVILGIAARLNRTPAQVLLAWAAQRGTAFLTTPETGQRAKEVLASAVLPDEAFEQVDAIHRRARQTSYAVSSGTGTLLLYSGPRCTRSIAGGV
ncbi:2,5-diketo-D-gluconate reductase B [Burkholderia sp. 8Y]|nr:2,5-diketo-D-gluconate reductase B [Burkholderia sp. 8Y]